MNSSYYKAIRRLDISPAVWQQERQRHLLLHFLPFPQPSPNLRAPQFQESLNYGVWENYTPKSIASRQKNIQAHGEQLRKQGVPKITAR